LLKTFYEVLVADFISRHVKVRKQLFASYAFMHSVRETDRVQSQFNLTARMPDHDPVKDEFDPRTGLILEEKDFRERASESIRQWLQASPDENPVGEK
jgi:hypothetical protein